MLVGNQLGFKDYELTTAKMSTKCEKFLAEMETAVPRQTLIHLIAPHYPKASRKGGRPPSPLAMMLRIHLLKLSYCFIDPAMEEALNRRTLLQHLAVMCYGSLTARVSALN